MLRREVLKSLAALAAAAPSAAWADAPGLRLGPQATPFGNDTVPALARAMAAKPYAPRPQIPESWRNLTYDQYRKIWFNARNALWNDTPRPLRVDVFPPGLYFPQAVTLNVVEDGQSRPLGFDLDVFDTTDKFPDVEVDETLGYSGLRLRAEIEKPGIFQEYAVFQGASYFRAIGRGDTYGLSARGLALKTADPKGEEFPDFTALWLEAPAPNTKTVVMHALLDSPSCTGAYRFEITAASTTRMDVTATIFARERLTHMGIAPLTSMFWFGEHNRHQARDWRPEIHDSDGLAMWTGAGERLWRPLNNPSSVMTNSFVDDNPKGFGLMQRDRAFHNYEDDGVFYDRRASVWIEPLGDWGKGAVQLVEIPTDDEIHDNIVMYWLPEQPVKAGSEWSFDYRLFWNADEPYPSEIVARATHTRLGNGGVPGQPRPEGVKKFVIDFEGGPLEGVEKLDEVEPIISASSGEISNDYALQVVGTKHWRAFFDLKVEGNDPVNLRLYLQLGDKTLTETWLYQYHPFPYT